MQALPEPAVLIVEDHPHIRKLVNASLRPLDIRIDQAATADEALQFLEGGGVAYTVIILDIMLPGSVNGLQICRKVTTKRAASGNTWPYVIVLSARVQKDDQRLALESGADLFMPKPFSPLQLLEAVRSHYIASDRGG